VAVFNRRRSTSFDPDWRRLSPGTPVRRAATRSFLGKLVGAIELKLVPRTELTADLKRRSMMAGKVGYMMYLRRFLSDPGFLLLHLSLSLSPMRSSLTRGFPRRDFCLFPLMDLVVA